jgi:hypothetical protein
VATSRALGGVSYFCAKRAHSIYYSLDVAYKNPRTASTLDSLTAQADLWSNAPRWATQTLALFGKAAWPMLNSTAPTVGFRAYVPPDKLAKYVSMGDRFSKDTMTGPSNTADCDDMGGGNAMNDFMTPHQLHAQFGPGASPLLNAFVRLTKLFVPFACGSMVTAAYFDENKNTPMDNDARRAMLDLPLKNSIAYQKADKGGHCHLLLNPRVDTAAELQRAGQFSNELITQAVGSNFAPWEYKLCKVLVEGTGQVGGLSVLAAGEIHPGLVGEATQLRLAKRHINQNCPILRENFRGMAGNFYAERPPNPDRATNSFFRVFEHLMAPTLYEVDPRMGHFLVCDKSDRTRGVDAESYLRKTQSHMLVSHMADLPRNVLDSREELYACIDHQQALNITYRFKEDFSHPNHLALPHQVSMSRIGHQISLSLFNGTTADTLRAQLDKHALGAYATQGMTLGAGLTNPEAPASRLCRPESAVLTLFIRPWHMMELDRTGLERELASLRTQGIVEDADPVVWHERPLGACEDMLTLCMSVPLK